MFFIYDRVLDIKTNQKNSPGLGEFYCCVSVVIFLQFAVISTRRHGANRWPSGTVYSFPLSRQVL